MDSSYHRNAEYINRVCDGNSMFLGNAETCDICGKRIGICKCLEGDEKEEEEYDS